ncbi:MAG TPA: bacteriohopanetetrol glucosamine biosynthesis glycosyltransferase HpnI [Terriglobia bacterium]|nr:bacteriohopanetetrol glucosamine biosynthesis glycosyltransferase HpnI [Terriglobia bacterium]
MVVIHLRTLIMAAAVVPLIFYSAAMVCAWSFFRRRNQPASGFAPPLSVLKPMRGSYRDAYRNLASFCRQDYPGYEILFGVNDRDDAVIPVIRRLMAEFPAPSIRLLVGSAMPASGGPDSARSGAAGFGSNDKVVKLCRLAREARHDILVVSDGDISVEPDYLRRVAAAFRDPRVGVATCLYRGSTERNVWSELEGLSLTTDFMAGVLVARGLGLRFALGATMAVRREALAAIGGFEALADAAADDHELGGRVAAQGFRMEFAETTPETECSTRDFRSYFRHHLRWAIVTRTSQPWGHVGFLFAQGLPWVIAAAIVAPSWRISAAVLAAFVVLRLALAFTLGFRGLRDRLVKTRWWLLPLRDALAFVIWFASLFVSRIHWQDATYDVRHGRLMPVPERPMAAPEHASMNCRSAGRGAGERGGS